MTESKLNSKKHPVTYRWMSVLAIFVLVMMAYLLWARPYQLQWGATNKEVNQPMPGDELDPDPNFRATRAITIDATPEKIWPWLVQMGYTRAGFYGYDILENLGSPRGITSARSIISAFQHFQVGDEVPISPAAGLVFYAIEPYHYLIWSGKNGRGGFIWALYPVDKYHTRLVSRILWSHHWTSPGLLPLDLFTEFTDHLAVRKILYGIKGRVEGHIEPALQVNTEFGIYLATLLLFLVTIILILFRPLTLLRWIVGLATGAIWLITWYAPVPVWFGAVLVLLALLSLREAFRRPSFPKMAG